MTVIATFKLNHLIPSGKSSHQPQDCHTGFCSGIDEADHFDTGNRIDHHLR